MLFRLVATDSTFLAFFWNDALPSISGTNGDMPVMLALLLEFLMMSVSNFLVLFCELGCRKCSTHLTNE